ncbi:hypothetical protein [Draconibacterium sp.]|uniref:hypothetical protein n=1 Tax=Draconibacterium sp. TaxID=1965318 RepID=UPI0035647498
MEIYKYIADLFRYPTIDTLKSIQLVSEVLIKEDVVLASRLEGFVTFTNEKSLHELEEYYLQTFDIRAVCHLDIGYIIFGDDSKRGRFLYHIKEVQEKIGNDCGKDLADFLPNILTLLSKTKDKSFAEELSVSIVLPALEQMQQKLVNEKNIYRLPMGILINLLKIEFNSSEFEPVRIGSKEKPNFLNHYITGIDTSLIERKKFKGKR